MAYNNTTKNMQQTSELLNYYLTMNINNICRICLEKSQKLMPIFDPTKPPHFPILIMACASVQVNEGDGLPSYICQKCISRLNIAFQFKSQCESSDTKLRQCFENLKQLPESCNEDVIEFEDVTDSSIYEQHKIEDGTQQQVTTASNDMKMENQLEVPQNFDLESNSSTLEPIEKIDLSDIKVETHDLKSEHLNLDIEDPINCPNAKPKKSQKQHQCDLCGKVLKTKPGLNNHIRIHTGERPYVCHLCDKKFINGGHLHTHMRTHTGEKNHVCAACNKAFSTAQQLTKHTIAIHTSVRPYGCTYCPKRFASSSNLNTHIKIHTGEKNYHCNQCTKSFSTKAQLYQHNLVHTGEKAFLCEYCHRRFSQKAHLIRHLKMHKSYT